MRCKNVLLPKIMDVICSYSYVKGYSVTRSEKRAPFNWRITSFLLVHTFKHVQRLSSFETRWHLLLTLLSFQCSFISGHLQYIVKTDKYQSKALVATNNDLISSIDQFHAGPIAQTNHCLLHTQKLYFKSEGDWTKKAAFLSSTSLSLAWERIPVIVMPKLEPGLEWKWSRAWCRA